MSEYSEWMRNHTLVMYRSIFGFRRVFIAEWWRLKLRMASAYREHSSK